MRILLQHKIFMGYFLLMAIIGSMVAIVLHERNRVQKIENESITILQTQHDINTAHRYVTALVTYGESVLVWDNEDTLAYRKRRVQTDSILQVLHVKCEDFIRPAQIDSLRTLLAAKEVHLFQIMEAMRRTYELALLPVFAYIGFFYMLKYHLDISGYCAFIAFIMIAQWYAITKLPIHQ